MKKFLILLFAALYVTAASGTPVYLQYCKDRLVDFNLGLGESKDCNNCPFENAGKHCCDYEQLQADQVNNTTVVSLSNLFFQVVVPDNLFRVVVPPIAAVQIDYPASHGPPVVGKIALFIINCTFRL